MKKFIRPILLFGFLLTTALAHADNVVVGVNWFGEKPDDLDPAIQETRLSAMQNAGVHFIRCGLNPDPGNPRPSSLAGLGKRSLLIPHYRV